MANYKQIMTSYYGNPDVDTLPTATSKSGWTRYDKDNAGVVKFYISDGTTWIEPTISSTIASNSITGAMLQAGIITDAKIYSGAAIAKTKLAALNIGDSDVSSHTTTKITTTSKSLLNSQIGYKDETAWLTNAMIVASAGIPDSKLAQITDKTKLHSDLVYRQLAYNRMRDFHSPIASGRKYARLTGFITTPFEGTGQTVSAATGQASPVSNISTTMGRYETYTTGTTTGQNGGGHASNIFQRAHNPYWSFRGRLASAYTASTLRSFFGLSSDGANSPSASDNYADSKSVAMIGHRTTDTTFQFIHNDASGTALYDNTTISVNATVHTWEIFGDETGGRFGWAVDGGAINWAASQAPASTTNLGVVHEIQTNDSGVAKSYDMIGLYIEFDSK